MPRLLYMALRSGVVNYSQRLRAPGGNTIASAPLPFLQPLAVVSLLAATMALTSVQAPPTLITAASAWLIPRARAAPIRILGFIAARIASVNLLCFILLSYRVGKSSDSLSIEARTRGIIKTIRRRRHCLKCTRSFQLIFDKRRYIWRYFTELAPRNTHRNSHSL